MPQTISEKVDAILAGTAPTKQSGIDQGVQLGASLLPTLFGGPTAASAETVNLLGNAALNLSTPNAALAGLAGKVAAERDAALSLQQSSQQLQDATRSIAQNQLAQQQAARQAAESQAGLALQTFGAEQNAVAQQAKIQQGQQQLGISQQQADTQAAAQQATATNNARKTDLTAEQQAFEQQQAVQEAKRKKTNDAIQNDLTRTRVLEAQANIAASRAKQEIFSQQGAAEALAREQATELKLTQESAYTLMQDIYETQEQIYAADLGIPFADFTEEQKVAIEDTLLDEIAANYPGKEAQVYQYLKTQRTERRRKISESVKEKAELDRIKSVAEKNRQVKGTGKSSGATGDFGADPIKAMRAAREAAVAEQTQ